MDIEKVIANLKVRQELENSLSSFKGELDIIMNFLRDVLSEEDFKSIVSELTK